MSQWLMACSTLQDLPAINGRSAYGSWLDLNDTRRLTLSPGVFLELPDAPYRARFADKDGIYFQASRPLLSTSLTPRRIQRNSITPRQAQAQPLTSQVNY